MRVKHTIASNPMLIDNELRGHGILREQASKECKSSVSRMADREKPSRVVTVGDNGHDRDRKFNTSSRIRE
jgi:metallophosphoesterase superfamily enzyme